MIEKIKRLLCRHRKFAVVSMSRLAGFMFENHECKKCGAIRHATYHVLLGAHVERWSKGN